MARRLRIDLGGFVYHVLNRRVRRLTLFDKEYNYAAFLKVLDEAHAKLPMRVLAYCRVPNWCENPFSHPRPRESFPALLQDRNPTKSACEMGISHERGVESRHRPARKTQHKADVFPAHGNLERQGIVGDA